MAILLMEKGVGEWCSYKINIRVDIRFGSTTENIQCEAPQIAFSWFITPISLWFMVPTTIVNGFINHLTSLGGPTL